MTELRKEDGRKDGTEYYEIFIDIETRSMFRESDFIFLILQMTLTSIQFLMKSTPP